MRTINLSGKEFPIRFDMNTMEQIQTRYDKIETMFDKLQQISESKWVLALIIAEGIAFDNYTNSRSAETPNEQQIGMLVSLKDLNDRTVTQSIVDAFNDCMGAEKNVTAGELINAAETIKASVLPA